MSTVGFLCAPLSFDFVRSCPVELSAIDWKEANKLLEDMQAEGKKLLQESGVKVKDIRHERSVDIRYLGQGYEIRVALPTSKLKAGQENALIETFEIAYKELYERLGPPVGLEILSWRVVSSGPQPNFHLERSEAAKKGLSKAKRIAAAIKAERKAYFPETKGFTKTKIYDRYALFPGDTFDGPAIVEERESTAIIGPNAKCSIDKQHNLVVEMG